MTAGDWQAGYAAALAPITVNGTAAQGVDVAVWTWLTGAKMVNQGGNSYSDFIRTYTASQYEIRNGGPPGQTDIQNASNLVALNVLQEIVATSALPTLSVIGNIDAVTVADAMFDGERGAWSGNLLFSALGTNEFLSSNILGATDPAYELAAMLKSGWDNISTPAGITSAISALFSAYSPDLPQFSTASAAISAVNAKFLELYNYSLLSMQLFDYTIDTVDNDGFLEGTLADDWMVGGSGADTLFGSADTDILDGGSGNDTADYSDASGSSMLTIKVDASNLGTPAAAVDVVATLTEKASKSGQKLNWKTSIVDLMKLLDLDSSLSARKELAKELGYTGDTGDSATMNVWLIKAVMKKLAENGGKVPDDLKD